MKKRFIFDEKYNKKNAKKESLKWLIIGVAVLALIIVIIIIILATRNNKPQPAIPQFELNTELILESGSPLPKVVDYFLKYENIDLNDVKITYPSEFEVSFDTSLCSKAELEEINKQENFEPDDYDCVQSMLKAPNTYGVTISLLEKDYTVNLIVKDTTAPVILTNKVEIYSDQSYSVNDFVKLCFDINDECNVSYYNKDTAGNDFDYSAFKDEGTYTIRLIGTDKFGNVSNPVETELKIIKPVAPIYTVTFNSNGGTSVESLLVEEGNKISEPAMPEKEGYNFLGWYLNNQKYDFSSSVMMNITLIAKWEKVENNTGDGSGNETGGNTGTIKPTIIQVSSLSLNYKKIYLYINDSKTVKATVYPSNATSKSVTWKSSNNSIAKVDNGKITGLKVGEVTISATAGGKTASVIVVVKEKNTGVVCNYGDTSYDKDLYILSVDLTQNNCAVNPNISYNETVTSTDYKKLVQELSNLGFSITSDSFYYQTLKPISVKNLKGTGLVGYQLSALVKVKSTDGLAWLTAEYIIKPDGTRKFVQNSICSAAGCLK